MWIKESYFIGVMTTCAARAPAPRCRPSRHESARARIHQQTNERAPPDSSTAEHCCVPTHRYCLRILAAHHSTWPQKQRGARTTERPHPRAIPPEACAARSVRSACGVRATSHPPDGVPPTGHQQGGAYAHRRAGRGRVAPQFSVWPIRAAGLAWTCFICVCWMLSRCSCSRGM